MQPAARRLRVIPRADRVGMTDGPQRMSLAAAVARFAVERRHRLFRRDRMRTRHRSEAASARGLKSDRRPRRSGPQGASGWKGQRPARDGSGEGSTCGGRPGWTSTERSLACGSVGTCVGEGRAATPCPREGPKGEVCPLQDWRRADQCLSRCSKTPSQAAGGSPSTSSRRNSTVLAPSCGFAAANRDNACRAASKRPSR